MATGERTSYGRRTDPVHLPGGVPPKKGLIRNLKIQVLKLRFLAFPQGPGGFRKVRGAGRNHFHLSWYLSVSVVTSYDQKPWGETDKLLPFLKEMIK